jgi:cell wall-associated NlpC family hydrolase
LRTLALGRTYALALTFVLSALALTITQPARAANTGGAGPMPLPPSDTGGGIPPGPPPGPPPTTSLPTAQLSPDGRAAIPPAAAPPAVKAAIYAANKITSKPYRYGGGHRSFEDSGYDCSGSVSYALRGGGLLKSPLPSSGFMRWGTAGRGAWITVYTNPGHAFVLIAGLRFDTSGPGERGPRWRRSARSSRSYNARHPLGL